MSVANVLKLHGDITGVTLRGLSWKKNLKHIYRACKSIVVQI